MSAIAVERSAPARLRAAASRGLRVLGPALLIAASWYYYSICLNDGSVLDDHWHQKGLREHGWSLEELLRTLVIRPSQFIECWWQEKDFRWEYGRPLFILAMKVVYHVLGGDDPWSLHLFSLMLHAASAILVWRLAWALTGSSLWALVAGYAFIEYPHAPISVSWPSALNGVLQTTLMLAAMCVYVRASRLDLRCIGRPASAPSGSAGELAFARGSDGRSRPNQPFDRGSTGGLVAVALLWTLALFTKETAIVLPAILLGLEASFGGLRRVWQRRWFWSALAAIGLAFIAWRMATVTHPMPDVYVRRPSGDWPEYLPWLAAKLLHYVTTAIWPAPMVIGPTGRFNPWSEAAGDCFLMLAIVAVLATGYAFATRGVRGAWLWPAWILSCFVLVVPVIATPHTGYMAGPGVALGIAVVGAAARARGWAIRLSAQAAALLLVVAMNLMAIDNRWQWESIRNNERYAVDWLLADPPDEPVRDVFFINLPFTNIYIKPALDRALGPAFAPVRCHALVFAPDAYMVQQRVSVQVLDPHSLAVSIEDQLFFSRLLGRFLIGAYRHEPYQFEAGQTFTTASVSVRIAQTGADGVQKLVFTFPRRLDDPGYAFYLTTTDCAAARLRFRLDSATAASPAAADEVSLEQINELAAKLDAGNAEAGAALLALASGPGDATTAQAAQAALRPCVSWTANALGSPMAPALDRGLVSPAEWKRIEEWWRGCVTSENLKAVWTRRGEFAHYEKGRADVPTARRLAGQVIRTDLYLTGPPFPGPRKRPQ